MLVFKNFGTLTFASKQRRLFVQKGFVTASHGIFLFDALFLAEKRFCEGSPRTVTFASQERLLLQLHTAATGFAGICTDAALPLCLAASVLSRVFSKAKTRCLKIL